MATRTGEVKATLKAMVIWMDIEFNMVRAFHTSSQRQGLQTLRISS